MKAISLIGFMGCGKSSVGKLLVQKLDGFKLIDLDDYIERKSGRTIPDIFNEDGEKAFRAMETEALAEIFENRDAYVILSLGGGTVTVEESRKLLKLNSFCIYLRASADTLESNLGECPGNRPLLKAGKPLRARIEELLEARSDIYEDSADHVIDLDGKTYEQATDEIASLIAKF